jgi:hypothetical protein
MTTRETETVVLPPAIALRGEPPSIGRLRARHNELMSEIVDTKNPYAAMGYQRVPEEVKERVAELERELASVEAQLRADDDLSPHLNLAGTSRIC